MALIITIAILLLSPVYTIASSNDPFPVGYSMATQGTIIQDNWLSSREPWLPALLINDEQRFGVAIGATSFYDRMDNLENRSLYCIYGGGWFAVHKWRYNLSLSQFEALGIYYEQQGFVSVGRQLWKQSRLSVNVSGYRNGIHTDSKQYRTGVNAGISALYKFRLVATTATVENILLKRLGDSAVDPDICFNIGIHTKYSQVGAQGVVVKIIPDAENPVRFILGEEFRFNERIGIHASISNNPIFIGIGFFAGFKKYDINVGIVNHPDLGWSRGFSTLYGK